MFLSCHCTAANIHSEATQVPAMGIDIEAGGRVKSRVRHQVCQSERPVVGEVVQVPGEACRLEVQQGHLQTIEHDTDQ